MEQDLNGGDVTTVSESDTQVTLDQQAGASTAQPSGVDGIDVGTAFNVLKSKYGFTENSPEDLHKTYVSASDIARENGRLKQQINTPEPTTQPQVAQTQQVQAEPANVQPAVAPSTDKYAYMYMAEKDPKIKELLKHNDEQGTEFAQMLASKAMEKGLAPDRVGDLFTDDSADAKLLNTAYNAYMGGSPQQTVQVSDPTNIPKPRDPKPTQQMSAQEKVRAASQATLDALKR